MLLPTNLCECALEGAFCDANLCVMCTDVHPDTPKLRRLLTEPTVFDTAASMAISDWLDDHGVPFDAR